MKLIYLSCFVLFISGFCVWFSWNLKDQGLFDDGAIGVVTSLIIILTIWGFGV